MTTIKYSVFDGCSTVVLQVDWMRLDWISLVGWGETVQSMEHLTVQLTELPASVQLLCPIAALFICQKATSLSMNNIMIELDL